MQWGYFVATGVCHSHHNIQLKRAVDKILIPKTKPDIQAEYPALLNLEIIWHIRTLSTYLPHQKAQVPQPKKPCENLLR